MNVILMHIRSEYRDYLESVASGLWGKNSADPFFIHNEELIPTFNYSNDDMLKDCEE